MGQGEDSADKSTSLRSLHPYLTHPTPPPHTHARTRAGARLLGVREGQWSPAADRSLPLHFLGNTLGHPSYP